VILATVCWLLAVCADAGPGADESPAVDELARSALGDTTGDLARVAPGPALALVGGLWYNGSGFEARALYVVDGVFRADPPQDRVRVVLEPHDLRRERPGADKVLVDITTVLVRAGHEEAPGGRAVGAQVQAD
jgi:hypothetical protein